MIYMQTSPGLLRRIMRSRLGLVLAGVHLCLVLVAFWMKGENKHEIELFPITLIAGRSIHWGYETLLLRLLILLDIPALILSQPIGWLLLPGRLLPGMSSLAWSWIGPAILLCATSAQWWLIGYLIQRLLLRRATKK